MLRPGIFSMSDFHVFRLYEYDKCVADLQIPCRWAPDAGFGYGEPVFNFYMQIPYLIGEIFHIVGFQLIDSIKILFILSLVGSAISMFFLARQIWGNNLSAILSAVVYVWAPYRAVDVWVRGALPEAMAFIIFPLIILLINSFFAPKHFKNLVLLSLLLSLLLITHNLSFLMFMPFLFVWVAFLSFLKKEWKPILPIIGSFIFALFMSAFYLLPVILESKFVHLDLTTRGYFDFRGHFTTIYQLLISRFWGYGASLFGPVDDISLSVGQIQWMLPIVTLLGFLVKKKDWKKLAALIFIGWFALFMSHNKSALVWEKLPFLAYIQFPWRWLSIATFSFAIASGGLVPFLRNRYKNIVISCIILLTVLINIPFFREDIWKEVSDKEIFSGKLWEEQISASLPDYWPSFAQEMPSSPAPNEPILLSGEGNIVTEEKKSNKVSYKINIQSDKAEVQFPIVFFPGWKGMLDDRSLDIYPSGDFGLITADIKKATQTVSLSFGNTPVRTIGNIISLISALIFILLISKFRNTKLYV